MARTVNEAAQALRRDEFLDAAQRLLETKGYDRMSIQDVLAALGTSKGAFYHYFASKQALLDAVVQRFADRIAAALAPVADDPVLTALEKLGRFFATLAGWKIEQRELLIALLEVWYSDDNAVVRQKLRPGIADRIAPLLATIIGQGVSEGVFTVSRPAQAARVVVSLIQDLNDRLADLTLAHRRNAVDMTQVDHTVDAYTDALERILAAPAGSVHLVDERALRPWFQSYPEARQPQHPYE